MATPAAERQRRSRRHRAGDHSLCDPRRCDAVRVTEQVTEPVPVTPSRGELLWQDMAGDALPPDARVLLTEACRIADRLDHLDAMLRGDEREWFRVAWRNGVQKLVVDEVLGEARQHALSLKTLLADLRQARGKTDQPAKREGGSDDLAARRAARRAAAGL